MEDKKRKKEDKKKKESAQKVGFDIWILLSSRNINCTGVGKMLDCLYLSLKTLHLKYGDMSLKNFYIIFLELQF